MATEHGITRVDANAEIKKFMEIRGELYQPDVVAQLSPSAQAYVSSNHLSFVFYKDQLDALFSTVDANAYRVYLAAKSSGQPSLVIVPCELSADEYSVSNRLSTAVPPGQQYPVPRDPGSGFTSFDIDGD
jgi:hypothetical protein